MSDDECEQIKEEQKTVFTSAAAASIAQMHKIEAHRPKICIRFDVAAATRQTIAIVSRTPTSTNEHRREHKNRENYAHPRVA